jgi:hypothetical protein
MPGPTARVLMCGVVVVVLAACSQPPDNAAPPNVVAVAVPPSLTADQARHYVSVMWDPVSTPGTAQDLPVTVPGAGCGRLRGARVAETSTDVTVEVYASLEDCSEPAPGSLGAVVRPPSPLGGRQLRHGAATTLPVAPLTRGSATRVARQRGEADVDGVACGVDVPDAQSVVDGASPRLQRVDGRHLHATGARSADVRASDR